MGGHERRVDGCWGGRGEQIGQNNCQEGGKVKRWGWGGRVIMKTTGLKRKGREKRKKNPINNPVQELWRCHRPRNVEHSLLPFSLPSPPLEFFPWDN